MMAERQTMDRFTAVFLANQVDKIFEAKVTGVTRAGLFLTLEATGADGLAPISTLGHDFFVYDQDRHTLTGERTGVTYRLADRLMVRLREVDIVTGGVIVSIEDGDGKSAYKSRRGQSRRGGKGPASDTPARGKIKHVKKKKRTTPKGKKRAAARKST